MSQQILNAVSAVFSLCAFVFFIIGCIGYSVKDQAIKDVSWINVDENGLKLWMGLQKFHYSSSGFSATESYKDCNQSFCDECEEDGKSAFGLIIISTIFAAVCTGLGGALAASPTSPLQIANLALSFISAAFAIIGFGVFMGNCYKKVDDYGDFDLEWGSGSIIVCLGLIMMWVVVVMQLVAMIMGPGSS